MRPSYVIVDVMIRDALEGSPLFRADAPPRMLALRAPPVDDAMGEGIIMRRDRLRRNRLSPFTVNTGHAAIVPAPQAAHDCRTAISVPGLPRVRQGFRR